MRAEIVSIGTELLLGQITDTNAAELGATLAETGIDHYHRQTVGDHQGRLVEALRLALARAEIVFTIGGLGPTEDDLTRNAIAEATESELVLDSTVEQHLRELFTRRSIPWTDSQARQAMRPSHATVIQNPNGTAPGLICPVGDKFIIALPGPKNEFRAMLLNQVRTWLIEVSGAEAIISRVLRVVGIGEAMVEKELLDLMQATDPTLAPYAKVGEVHLRLTTRGDGEQGQARLERLEQEIRSRLGTAVFATGETTLEAVIVDATRSQHGSIAVAESCTGGGLGAAITSVDGASDVFMGGIVAYTPEVKFAALDVSWEILNADGPVSEACAKAMADGARSRLNSTFGVSITGVAGTEAIIENGIEKPSGLVFVGLSTETGTKAFRFQFSGNRETIRTRAVRTALMLIRRELLKLG